MATTLFVPARKVLVSVTNTVRAIVTVTVDHDYITGDIVRMYIPDGFGMYQMNHLFAPVEIIDATSFFIDIDSRDFEPFVIPVGSKQSAQCIAIGEVNEELLGAVHNSLNPN